MTTGDPMRWRREQAERWLVREVGRRPRLRFRYNMSDSDYAERSELIAEARHRGATLAAIGAALDISTARVSQLEHRGRLPPMTAGELLALPMRQFIALKHLLVALDR